MMGIKSKQLYQDLTQIVIERDVSPLECNIPSEFLGRLFEHMLVSIPQDIFSNEGGSDGWEHDVGRLQHVVEYIEINFARNNTYPFTIQRLCELCYHPLKYFKIHELKKFVNAVEKVSFVRSSWTKDYGVSENLHSRENPANGNQVAQSIENGDSRGYSENVSISKIQWLGSRDTGNLKDFIEKIESIVSVTFGYDEEEEEDEEDRDVIIQECYEEDTGVDTEEEDEEDRDYVLDEASTSEDEDEDDGEDDMEDVGPDLHNDAQGANQNETYGYDKQSEASTGHNIETTESYNGEVASVLEDLGIDAGINLSGTKRRPTKDLDGFNFRETKSELTEDQLEDRPESSILINSPHFGNSVRGDDESTNNMNNNVFDSGEHKSASLGHMHASERTQPILISPTEVKENTEKMTAISQEDSPLRHRAKGNTHVAPIL
ncbi:HDL321Wp [Eremothecium sinecaudum]|uniref:HDL321Wp n=1 Tax=Eremothecium sinecaudum TaxID=45286 RepID=A0A0X8HS65_9SACH|nr:HDL321Wp [Eremothecium sinecaudum]AMD20423.1 HDL321Wp [Eremothecium sinecaudum]